MTLSPKESGKFIASSARDVFIEDEKVTQLATAVFKAISTGDLTLDNFLQCEFHPKDDDPKAVDWIFVLDTLNFSFWTATGEKKWMVNGQTGYFALCAAVKRAIEEGKPILDPAYYSKITLDDAEAIFRGDDKEVEIPLMQERLQVLHEAGDVLLRKYQGTFETCIKSCKGSALKLLDLIVNEFKAYRDEAVYEGQRVSLYKRAQILIGDIWSCFKGCGIGEFHDINSITMFADYRIPQVFLYFGAFRYSDSLLKKLQAGKTLVTSLSGKSFVSPSPTCLRRWIVWHFTHELKVYFSKHCDYYIFRETKDSPQPGCQQRNMSCIFVDEPLESGSREEVEIRGCSIELVERLCIEVRKMIDQTCLNPKAQKVAKHVNAILIDQFLWDYRRKFAKEIDEKHLPFHKTRCIYY